MKGEREGKREKNRERGREKRKKSDCPMTKVEKKQYGCSAQSKKMDSSRK